jgi:hypothetical protein
MRRLAVEGSLDDINTSRSVNSPLANSRCVPIFQWELSLTVGGLSDIVQSQDSPPAPFLLGKLTEIENGR